MADQMSEALQAMEANEPQANLYRAAEEYVSDQAYELMGIGDDDDFNKLTELMKQAIIYGAHWKEQQMMKNAVLETEVFRDACGDGIETEFSSWLTLKDTEIPEIPETFGLKDKDKVVVLVIKQD